jgi:hypothetical protein
MAEAPDACPRCAADGVTFLVQRPVWWLERYDAASAMTQLERTPARVRGLLDRIPTTDWPRRPDPGTWSPHEVLSHLRDAQGVLEQRVEAILEHDDPDLEAKMVWSWNQEARPATTQDVGAASTTASTVMPYLRSSGRGGPDSPKVSRMPTISTRVGRVRARYSATAPPRPPITVCSSTVTMARQSAGGGVERRRVERLERVHVDHARLDAAARQLVGRAQRQVEHGADADDGDVVARRA